MKKAVLWWLVTGLLGVLGIFMQYNLLLTSFGQIGGIEVPKLVIWQVQTLGPSLTSAVLIWAFPKMLICISAFMFWWRLYRPRRRQR